jgi:hypothetical protein
MQTRCHGQSVTKLVRTASAASQAEWPSEKDSCRHAARLVRDGASQDSTASAASQAGWPSGAACQWSNEIG